MTVAQDRAETIPGVRQSPGREVVFPECLPPSCPGRDRDDARRIEALVAAAVASVRRGREPRIATHLVPSRVLGEWRL